MKCHCSHIEGNASLTSSLTCCLALIAASLGIVRTEFVAAPVVCRCGRASRRPLTGEQARYDRAARSSPWQSPLMSWRWSESASRQEFLADRADDDHDVHAQRPPLDVMEIVIDPRDRRPELGRASAAAADLREPGNARPRRMALKII